MFPPLLRTLYMSEELYYKEDNDYFIMSDYLLD